MAGSAGSLSGRLWQCVGFMDVHLGHPRLLNPIVPSVWRGFCLSFQYAGLQHCPLPPLSSMSFVLLCLSIYTERMCGNDLYGIYGPGESKMLVTLSWYNIKQLRLGV